MGEKKKSVYNQRRNIYTQEYIREKYRQLSIRLPKEGEITREKIAEAAKDVGLSTNAYIVEAVSEKMDRQGFGTVAKADGT